MNCRLTAALILAIFPVMLFPTPAAAQVRGGGHFAGARAPRTAAPSGRSGFGSRGGRGFYRRGGLYYPGYFPGSGYFSDWAYLPPPFYPDYGYDYGNDSGYEPEALQAPPSWLAASHSDTLSTPAKPVEPLVLERQGDEWVRIGGYGQPGVSAPSTRASAEGAQNPPAGATYRNLATSPAPKLPPAVLVFRDGHQEEIEKYTIIGSVIYAQADYWSTGSWRRKVAIADLDIPATLKMNRERGGRFSLPSGPNEVVFRP